MQIEHAECSYVNECIMHLHLSSVASFLVTTVRDMQGQYDSQLFFPGHSIVCMYAAVLFLSALIIWLLLHLTLNPYMVILQLKYSHFICHKLNSDLLIIDFTSQISFERNELLLSIITNDLSLRNRLSALRLIQYMPASALHSYLPSVLRKSCLWTSSLSYQYEVSHLGQYSVQPCCLSYNVSIPAL